MRDHSEPNAPRLWVGVCWGILFAVVGLSCATDRATVVSNPERNLEPNSCSVHCLENTPHGSNNGSSGGGISASVTCTPGFVPYCQCSDPTTSAAGCKQPTTEWIPPENPSPAAILDQAGDDARNGRYREALAKHVWFHQNALSYDRSMGGVRVSFALTDWLNLGKVYPRAAAELSAIRDQAQQDSLNGHGVPQSFSDLSSINRALGEESITAEVFQALHRENSEVARQVFRYARPSLVKVGMFELCGHYIDPDQELAEMQELRDRTGQISASGDSRPELLDFLNKKYRNDAVVVVALLAANERHAEAERVAAVVKSELGDPAFDRELRMALDGQLPDPWP